MKKKRILFVASMCLLFVACFSYMKLNYTDPLARYPYAHSGNRDVILKYMDDKDIDFIISQKIKPEVFLGFIDLDGFQTKNCMYYHIAYQTRIEDRTYIINFINNYRSNFNLLSLEGLLSNYTYEDLVSFYDEKTDKYIENANLIVNPDVLLTTISKDSTLWYYEPSLMFPVETSTFVNSSIIEDQMQIFLKEEVHEPLAQLAKVLKEEFQKEYGGLVLTSGYISFADQVKIYNKAVLTYAFDEIQNHVDYPGQNEQQLGYSLTFGIPNMELDALMDSDQVAWLNEHAHEYGFIVRFPKAYETITNKKEQPLTLRYVGIEDATSMYEDKIPLEKFKKE